MKSGGSRLKSVYSQDMMSVYMSGEHLGSLSSVKASCSASLQTFDTLLLPQHRSQIRIFPLLVVSYCSSRARLHAYEALSSMSLPPRPLRNTRSYRPQTCPLPVVARLQGQRASLPERQQQLPSGCFNKMGAVVSTLSEAWNDLCGARRMSGLEERIAELDASQRYSQSLGLSACCAKTYR